MGLLLPLLGVLLEVLLVLLARVLKQVQLVLFAGVMKQVLLVLFVLLLEEELLNRSLLGQLECGLLYLLLVAVRRVPRPGWGTSRPRVGEGREGEPCGTQR